MFLSYFCLFVAVTSTALGQFFYKKYMISLNKQYYLLAIFLFLITPLCSFIALKNIAIDMVYISTSLTILFVIVLSRIFLKEQVGKRRYVGIGFILLGVVLYAL